MTSIECVATEHNGQCRIMTNQQLDPVLRLLLVDSDPQTLSVVRQSLRDYRGVQLSGVATTGPEAFELAANLLPDLILMDPDLPGSDGLFLMPQVMWPVEPTVTIMSADARYSLRGATRAGTWGFILKPVQAADLLATLDDALYSPGIESTQSRRRPPRDEWELALRRAQHIAFPFLHRWTGRRAAKSKAEAAARELLLTNLTQEEQQQLASQGYLEVKSPSRVGRSYHIPAEGGTVHMLENGRVTLLLCLESTESLPRSDVILMHKVLLQADEEYYLRTANQFTPSGQYLRRRQTFEQV